MNASTVLICDDNEAVHESLTCFLREKNISVISAYDGVSALKTFHEQNIDLIILDIMLPDMTGTDICRSIRMESNVPILFLSARGEEIDRVLGLELGADDYVTKPFSPREVSVRVQRILNRTCPSPKTEKKIFEELSVDTDTMDVYISGQKMDMTAKEVGLLSYMIDNSQKVLNREQILEAVWGYNYYGDTRAVDAVIKRIRQKLPDKIRFEIQSIYGVGYRLGIKR